jgi:hypothetical protein
LSQRIIASIEQSNADHGNEKEADHGEVPCPIRSEVEAVTQTDRDDFVTYDEFKGPDLDPALWRTVSLPVPTGGEHTAQDPNTEVAVGGGVVRVRIPRFSVSSDTFQPADSAKYFKLTTRQFELPPDRPVTFATDLAVKNIGGDPGDYRLGMADFQVTDLRSVFSIAGTATRVFAMHEHLMETDDPFVHVTESPYEDFDEDFTRLRECEITFDRANSTVVWRVDGHQVYKIYGTAIPERMAVAIGIWTQLPIRDGRSRSLRGQGLEARWGRFRVRGADA